MIDLPEGVNFNSDITYFAKTNFRNKDQVFGIKRKDRRQHVYVLGKSGTGKSAMLSNMVIQNIYSGEGVCVVDPHGELVESILETIPPHRVKDVIYFNPADTDYHVGFNVLQLDDPKYKHLVASGLMGIFTKIWANAWSARMEYILNNAILALLDTPGSTLLGIPRLLVDKDFRQIIINNLKDPVVKAFWIHEYEAWRDQFRNEAIAPIQNKVGQFLSTSIIRNVVGQAKSTIDLFEIMNEGKIFLVNVSKGRVGEDNSALLGGMLITKLQLAAMERVRIPEKDRRDFFLYVDEFQNFVTDSFAGILSEARKYRLDLTIAHQYIGQLSVNGSDTVRDAVFGNVGTMIVFRVGAADAEFLEKEFEPEFMPQDLVNIPNYHAYLKLMVDGVTSRPFSAVTMAPFQVDGGPDIAEQIIESSRDLYTRPREIVEKEIADWSGMMGGVNSDGSRSTTSTTLTEGKFKAQCSICGKDTIVPFEPQPGRPVYCKDCITKIKAGELQPLKSSPRPQVNESKSFNALASLGIEFNATPEMAREAAQKPHPVPISTPNIASAPSSHNAQRTTGASHPPHEEVRTTPRPFIPPKRRGPDISGLKSALSEALGDAPKANQVRAREEDKKLATEEVLTVKPKDPALSLSQLKKPQPVVSNISTKEASTEHVSALKNVIAQAMRPEPQTEEKKAAEVPLAQPPAPDMQAEQKKKEEGEKRMQEEMRQKEIREAKEKLVNLERIKKEAEDAHREEEKKRLAAEASALNIAAEKERALAEARKIKEIEIEKAEEIKRKEAEEASRSREEDTKPPTKKPKEVPADVLNNILKL